MVLCRPFRKLFFFLPIMLAALLFLLAACGSSTGSSSAGTPASAATHTVGSTNPSAAATAVAYQRLVSLIGQPTVKMLTGTSFEADGQVKNIDTFQHDITLQIVLKDASGKVIATGSELLDNVKAGTIVSYAIKGTTTQPTWASMEVVVSKVTENIGGTGGD